MPSSKTPKRIDSPKINSDLWMLTFGDLVMLLLTFFVLLLSMKSMDKKDLRELFPNPSLWGGPLKYSENGLTGNTTDFYGDNKSSILVENKDALKQIFTMMKEIQTSLPEKDVVNRFEKSILIEDDPKGVVISFQTEQLFEPGEATINPSKIDFLTAAGELLKKTSNNILIMGHASSIQPQKAALKSSWDLSLYRALHVLYYLTANFEMLENRLAVGGFGDKKPKFPVTEVENQKTNDRIEFILMKATE
ncbi:MAG: hypothetical protein C0403_00180 [Desulfobacterium sp.]|nr:hypothetical protein [Desulfobacterium sp.]